MKSIFLLSQIFFISITCNSQIHDLMNVCFGKKIDFKMHYDSLKAQYSPDSNYVYLENNSVLNLDYLNRSYKWQSYKKVKSIKTKVDFFNGKNDTLLITYVFFNNKLFEIDIYTNIKDRYKNLNREFEVFFNTNFIGAKPDTQKTSLNRELVIRKSLINSKFVYDLSNNCGTLDVVLMYNPVREYFPLWCATGKNKNWIKHMDKKLN